MWLSASGSAHAFRHIQESGKSALSGNTRSRFEEVLLRHVRLLAFDLT
jgi:hypothetical protein